MIRCAIRGLLQTASPERAALFRAALKRDDEYESAAKPACDWDDKDAREALVDALARDAYALLALLDGEKCSLVEQKAAELLATVVGQDIEQTEDGTFRIARRVAPDRVISTVAPEARHGHKTQARHFDGYKGHIAIDPDSEIITAATVTAGNVADGKVAKEMLDEVLKSNSAENQGHRARSPLRRRIRRLSKCMAIARTERAKCSKTCKTKEFLFTRKCNRPSLARESFAKTYLVLISSEIRSLVLPGSSYKFVGTRTARGMLQLACYVNLV